MTSKLFSFRAADLAIVSCLLLTLTGCQPEQATKASAEGDGSRGVYLASAGKLYERDLKFDVRWKVEHKKNAESFDPTTNVDNRQLALKRCNECHNECGFDETFDLANYGKPEWSPVYKGTDWALPIRRMMDKENAFLNDVIAERIYFFLRDETTIGYDLASDPKGAVEVEVDESGQPIQHKRETTPQP
jgi:hypothetical protein